MQQTPYIWQDGKLVKWEEATVHVLSHALHYGSAVFEGTRFYETDQGPAIFRLQEHTKRLFYSASALKMQIPYSEEQINAATKEVVVSSGITAGYIRPLAFFGYGKMGLNPKGAAVNVIIACWPWGKYLADRPLNVKISSYMRIHPKSVISDAKVSGHYVNSILASQEMQEEGYDEAILLDYEGNVAEGPGENIFLVKNGKIYTPPLGNVLKGITRDSVMTLASDLGYEIQEKTLIPEDLYAADELFFTGTAAEVSPIGLVEGKKIGTGEEGRVTKKIREKYLAATHGTAEEYSEWLTVVNEQCNGE